MRIWITEFEHEGIVYDGPDLVADTRQEAEVLAEDSGLNIVERVEDFVATEAGYATLH